MIYQFGIGFFQVICMASLICSLKCESKVINVSLSTCASYVLANKVTCASYVLANKVTCASYVVANKVTYSFF